MDDASLGAPAVSPCRTLFFGLIRFYLQGFRREKIKLMATRENSHICPGTLNPGRLRLKLSRSLARGFPDLPHMFSSASRHRYWAQIDFITRDAKVSESFSVSRGRSHQDSMSRRNEQRLFNCFISYTLKGGLQRERPWRSTTNTWPTSVFQRSRALSGASRIQAYEGAIAIGTVPHASGESHSHV
jgi:hypothetical protein